jgi:heme/copper-type cytochrome/quinol oxidase subunit 2
MRTPSKLIPLPIAALAFVLTVGVLAACGQGEGPQKLTFDLAIADRKLNLDPPTIKVKQGDSVTLNITTDVAGEFHLHGYDVKLDLSPGPSQRMELVANATGNFPIEFHEAVGGNHEEGSGEENELWQYTLGSLQVLPR